MDTDDPGRLTRSTGGGSAPRARLPKIVDRGGSIFVITAVLGALLLVARPVAAIGPLPDPAVPAALPSLPVRLPSVPLPTLPLPTLPRPTAPPPPVPTLPPLPLPTVRLPTPTLPPLPSLPVPTPTLPLPTPTLPPPPSLPIGASATPSPSPSTAGAGGSPGPSLLASALPSPAPGAGTLIGASGAPVDSSPVSGEVDAPIDGSSDSFLESLVVPGLLIGVPAIIIIGILIAQLAVGAAWLPVIRRWLHRRV